MMGSGWSGWSWNRRAYPLAPCGAPWVTQARGRPCRLAGRSLRASCPPVTRCWPRFAILAALGHQRRSIGRGDPEPSNVSPARAKLRLNERRAPERARARPPGGAAAGRRPGKAAMARDGIAAVKRVRPPGGGPARLQWPGMALLPCSQKIRPARAPKGPGRPFSSERGRPDRTPSKSPRAVRRKKAGAKGWVVSPTRRAPANGHPWRERPCRSHPGGLSGTEGSAVALLLLGDLLGSLLLLLGHGNGSLP